VSPLDSPHQLALSVPSSADRSESEDRVDSALSPRLLSPLSHEDVHSHISLSFYSQNGVFDRISSLVHTEPRTYYVADTLPDSEAEDFEDFEYVASTDNVDDGLGSSGSTWSLTHLDPVPFYHTPSSLAHQPMISSLLVTSYANYSAYPGDDRYPVAASTEYDEMLGSHDSHMREPDPSGPPSGGLSHDSHVIAPDFSTPTEVVEEGAMLQSDSVLTYPSFPLPPSTTHPPSSLPLPPRAPYPTSFTKRTDYVRAISYSSVTTTESQVGGDHKKGGDHRKAFEAGSIDIQGRDSFSSIKAHIEQVLSEATPEEEK
jgi:hypothetical protein